MQMDLLKRCTIEQIRDEPDEKKESLGPPRQPRGQKQLYSLNVGHKT